MYYFRDCYFDQQVAFGVARAGYARPRKTRHQSRPAFTAVVDVVLPFLCIGTTFAVGYMVLDVFGLEHLVRGPSLEAAGALLETGRALAADAAARLTALWNA